MLRSLLLALSLAIPAAALAQGTLSIGSDPTYPPRNYFADPAGLCGNVIGSIKGAAWLAELAKLNEGTCKDAPIGSRESLRFPRWSRHTACGSITRPLAR